jgi:hypothetical protein
MWSAALNRLTPCRSWVPAGPDRAVPLASPAARQADVDVTAPGGDRPDRQRRRPAGRTEAATSTSGITLNDSLAYALDGELLLDVADGNIDPADQDIPARAAHRDRSSWEVRVWG